MKFGRLQMRILSAVFAAVFIFTATLPVYASGSDPFDDYKNNVLKLTQDFCDSVDVTFDYLSDIYDEFVSTLDAAVLTGKSAAEATAYLAKEFIKWLKQHKLFGKTTEMHYNKPTFHIGINPDPNEYTQVVNTPTMSSDFSIDHFQTNWPFQNTAGVWQNIVFTNDDSFYQISSLKGTYTDINPNITFRNDFDSYPFLSYPGPGAPGSNSGSRFIYNHCDVLNSSSYPENMVVILTNSYLQNNATFWDCHIEDGYLYFDRQLSSYKFYVSYVDGSPYKCNTGSDNSGYNSNIQAPRNYFGNTFYGLVYGDLIYTSTSNSVRFAQGFIDNEFIEFDCSDFNASNPINTRLGLNPSNNFNTTYLDTEINNYYNVINQTINNYNNIDINLFLKILDEYFNNRIDGMDYPEALQDIYNKIDILIQELQEEQQDLADIKSALVKMKKYLKSIDQNVTSIFNRIDSLFTNTGAFALADQLDRLFHHLENTINALPIVTGGGGGDVNFNFGDLDLHLEATLNSFFTMNEEQKNEIAADVQTLKAPFNWVGDVTKNMKSLAGKMVARSAAYAGVGYTASAYIQDQDPFNTLNFTVSQNNNTGNSSGSINSGNNNTEITEDVNEEEITVSEEAGMGNSVNDNNLGGGLEPPKILIHFGNATSDINYGGDAVALDFSWYAPYKKYVDKFIVAFCWAVFLWHLVRSIPGIIGGVDGYVSDISGTITSENIDRRHAKTDAAYSKIGAFHRFRGR